MDCFTFASESDEPDWGNNGDHNGPRTSNSLDDNTN